MKISTKILLGSSLLLILGLCIEKALSGGPQATLDEYRDMYTGWCAYSIEVGAAKNSIEGCVSQTWEAGQSGEMSNPLHETFVSIDKMNEYIGFESAVRGYCDLIKNSPTDYEQLLGVTRIGELSYEDCKDDLVQMNLISKILESVPYDPSRSQGWRYESGITYRINGDVYNDPFGLDYKNGPNDVFGDGR